MAPQAVDARSNVLVTALPDAAETELMPVFEFRCAACDLTHEVIVLPGEDRPERCQDCGGDLRRLWSRVGVQLAGWGFARTDGYLDGRKPSADFKAIKDKASELFD